MLIHHPRPIPFSGSNKRELETKFHLLSSNLFQFFSLAFNKVKACSFPKMLLTGKNDRLCARASMSQNPLQCHRNLCHSTRQQLVLKRSNSFRESCSNVIQQILAFPKLGKEAIAQKLSHLQEGLLLTSLCWYSSGARVEEGEFLLETIWAIIQEIIRIVRSVKELRETQEEQDISACLSNRPGETVGTDKLLSESLDEN